MIARYDSDIWPARDPVKPSKMRNQKIWECCQCEREVSITTLGGHKRCDVCGSPHVFCHASKKEFHRWQELKLLQKQGQIRNLGRQVRIPLKVNGEQLKTPRGRSMVYVADFTYEEWREWLGEWWPMREDVKGRRAKSQFDVYWLKREILRANGVEVREI